MTRQSVAPRTGGVDRNIGHQHRVDNLLGRPPHGGRGSKLRGDRPIGNLAGRPPHGGRGSKLPRGGRVVT